jgi:hypothetical protein
MKTYDLRQVWNEDIQALKKLGRSMVEELFGEEAIDAEKMKKKLEAIRVHNTTIRTDIAIVKMTVTQAKMTVVPKKAAKAA